MGDVWIGIAVNVLLGVLEDKKIPTKYKSAVAKLYLALHANRLLFSWHQESPQKVGKQTDEK